MKLTAVNGTNAVWNNGNGDLFGYTADTSIMSRINRHKNWRIVCEYFDSATGKRLAVQYEIPRRQKRAAFHMFGVDRLDD